MKNVKGRWAIKGGGSRGPQLSRSFSLFYEGGGKRDIVIRNPKWSLTEQSGPVGVGSFLEYKIDNTYLVLTIPDVLSLLFNRSVGNLVPY